jgi:Ca2+-binding RTX toxin-like protein
MPITKYGTDDDDVLVGTDDNDVIYGYGGIDYIMGGFGDDKLLGGDGIDIISGGFGWDMSSYADSEEGVVVSLATGHTSGGTAEGDILVEIEWLEGSAFDDYLEGDGGSNKLLGHAGDDTLKGGGGSDELEGMDDDDVLVGGSGGDKLRGGNGIDTAAYTESASGVTVNLSTSHGDNGDPEGDIYWSIENVHGSAHADALFGNDGANRLEGRNGQDMIKGGGGVDSLWGGSGDDFLYGNDGIDTLRGEAGQDRLTGGAGEDILYGGANADTFVWLAVEETGLTRVSADRVSDFSAAQGDRIDLSGIDADVYGSGNQAFTFIGDAAFSGTPGELRYYHHNGNTFLEMQTGTSVDIEGLIRINGILTPEASWFVL